MAKKTEATVEEKPFLCGNESARELACGLAFKTNMGRSTCIEKGICTISMSRKLTRQNLRLSQLLSRMRIQSGRGGRRRARTCPQRLVARITSDSKLRTGGPIWKIMGAFIGARGLVRVSPGRRSRKPVRRATAGAR